MVGDEEDIHGLRVDGADVLLVVLQVVRQGIDVAAQGGGGDQPVHLGGGEMEAVEGLQVLIGDGVPIPDLRDGVDMGIDFLQLLHVPFPEGRALLIVPVIDVLRGVEAEAVDAQVQPVGRYVHGRLPDLFIVIIQLRHAFGEVALIEVARPEGTFEAAAAGHRIVLAEPGVVIVILVAGVVHLVGGFEIGEPPVIHGGVVQGQVQDQLHVPLMAQGDELLQVLQGAEGRVNPVKIRDVILMIGRGEEDGRQPDASDAQAGAGFRVPVVQVIHTVDDAPEVAGAVPVGIGKGSDEDFIKNPVIVFHIQALSFRGGAGAQQRQRQQTQNKPFHAYSLLS